MRIHKPHKNGVNMNSAFILQFPESFSTSFRHNVQTAMFLLIGGWGSYSFTTKSSIVS